MCVESSLQTLDQLLKTIFLCECLPAYLHVAMCVSGTYRGRRRCQIPSDWSYTWLLATMQASLGSLQELQVLLASPALTFIFETSYLT